MEGISSRIVEASMNASKGIAAKGLEAEDTDRNIESVDSVIREHLKTDDRT